MDKVGRFDMTVARRMGVSCGIILLELQRDMDFVKLGLGGQIVEGCPWILSSAKVLEQKHPYLTKDKIKTTLKKLKENNMIKTRQDINEHIGNRANWTTVNKEEEWKNN
jgi:hypothetical protein